MPRVSDERLKELAGMGLTEITLMARELELARKVVADLRARWPEANVLREYDAGETSEAPAYTPKYGASGDVSVTSKEALEAYLNRRTDDPPRRPSFAEALEKIISTYTDPIMAIDWVYAIQQARRASEGP